MHCLVYFVFQAGFQEKIYGNCVFVSDNGHGDNKSQTQSRKGFLLDANAAAPPNSNCHQGQNWAPFDYDCDPNIPHCQICSTNFSDRKEHQRHMNMHHLGQSQLPFACKYCQAGFYTGEGLKMHEIKHEGCTFRCEICDASFKIKSSVYRHLKTIHQASQCKHCGVIYPLKDAFSHVCKSQG